ncbi:P-loop containing nucleoside triphosphate hydrolase protein [Ramaria rubella]|nr:P-loop containing nucleoside triphosphate hydrolase protein [Ramaria rubella]
MSRQLLGKRPRSYSRASSPSPSLLQSPTPASKTRHGTRLPQSPDPTPNPKRPRISSTLDCDDDSNKENIPPDTPFGSLTPQATSLNSTASASASTALTTPSSIRTSRRAHVDSTRTTPVSRRTSASLRRSVSDLSSRSPSPSGRDNQVRSAIETPSKTMAALSLTTPPPTPVSTSPSSIADDTTTKPLSLYAQARALLRPQGHEASPLIGRGQERTQILDFLAPFLSDHLQPNDATSLYVSGAPGTGKTALINEVLSAISAGANTSSIRVIYVNCMALGAKDGLSSLWDRCVEELNASKDFRRATSIKVDWSERFSKLLQGKKCILVLDEIDHLMASISQVFTIAAAPQTRAFLRVIGISNTHTLTHAKPSPNTRTIHFEPYTAAQMKAVLTVRLATLPNDGPSSTKLFSPATLALLTMKIASQTGDIRTVFSVARRALDLAVTAAATSVTPAHILAALKASNASIGASQGKNGAETVTRVRNLGLHARFALAALLLATKRIASGLSLTGSMSSVSSGKLKENVNQPSALGREDTTPAIDMTALHGFYTAILSKGASAAFFGVGRTEFTDLIGLLEGSGLVELAQGRGFGSKMKGMTKSKGVQIVRIASGVRDEELIRGLVGCSAEGASVDVREEEVKHLWEREVARIGREAKTKFAKDTVKKGEFEGAEED